MEGARIKTLGAGANGSVEMVHLLDAYSVAKKAKDPREVKALLARPKSGGSCPNIIKLLGVGIDHIYLKVAEKGCLHKMYTHYPERLTTNIVQRYLRGIANGIDALHRAGIVHCDLKCKNVVVDAQDVPKITDFGKAISIEELKTAAAGDHIIGTMQLTAPETIDKRLARSKKIDVWNFGTMIFELMSGQERVYERKEPMAIAYNLHSGQFKGFKPGALEAKN